MLDEGNPQMEGKNHGFSCLSSQYNCTKFLSTSDQTTSMIFQIWNTKAMLMKVDYNKSNNYDNTNIFHKQQHNKVRTESEQSTLSFINKRTAKINYQQIRTEW